MRPFRKQVGTAALANGANATIDVSELREKSLQLFGTFGAGGNVVVSASLDGGTTFNQVATANAAGFVTLPQVMLGTLKVAVTAGDGTTAIIAWIGGMDSRTE